MGLNRDRASALALCELAGYAPFAWQRRFHLAGPRRRRRGHKLVVGGLGAGKSHAFAVEAAILAMLNPGGWGVISAPTYDQLTNVSLPRFLELEERLACAGFPLIRRYHKTQAIAEMWDGGKVFFRSMGKIDHLRSFEFIWGGLEEIETVIGSAEIWDVVAGRIRQRGNVPELFGVSTPKGLRGVVEIFHRNREALRATPELLDEWWWMRATSHDNPLLPAGYLDSLRATYSRRRWLEEVEAQILQPETGIWSSDIDPARHVARSYKFQPGVPYGLAYDYGGTYPHVLWIQRLADGTCIVFDEYCEDGMPLGKLHDLVVARCNALGQAPDHAVGDRAIPDEIAWMQRSFPRTQVHKMETQRQQSVSLGIETVRDRLDPIGRAPLLLFAERLVPSKARRGIWNCVRNYRFRQRGDGVITDEPYKDNVHDHGADALRMFIVALFGGTRAGFFNVGRRW